MKHRRSSPAALRGSAWRWSKRLLDDGWPVAVVDADRDALAAAETAFTDENAIFLAGRRDRRGRDRRRLRRGRRPARPDRRPGQFGRHCSKSLSAEETTRRAVPRDARRQSGRLVHHRQGGAGAHGRVAVDRQYRLGFRPARQSRPARLWRVQGRREADVGGAGAGIWQSQRPRELRGARPDRNACGGALAFGRGTAGVACATCRRAAMESPKRWPPPSPSCCRRKRVTSTAIR